MKLIEGEIRLDLNLNKIRHITSCIMPCLLRDGTSDTANPLVADH
jgi:hypothetical protein